MKKNLLLSVAVWMSACVCLADESLSKGLTAHFTFDMIGPDPGGVVNSIGKDNNATVTFSGTGSVLDATGRIDLAARITPPSAGSSAITADNGSVGDLGPGDFTISGWIYIEEAPEDNAVILDKGGVRQGSRGYAGYIFKTPQGDMNLVFYLGDDAANYISISTDVALSAGEWHHFALVVNRGGSQVSVYLDGRSIGEKLVPEGDGAERKSLVDMEFSTPIPLTFSGRYTGAINGMLDDFGFWSRALSDAEIAKIHTDGMTGIGLAGTSNGGQVISKPALYDACIYLITSGTTRLREPLPAAINDLQKTLEGMTGEQFQKILSAAGRGPSAPSSGIILARSDSPLAPAETVARLKGKGLEPFVIRSEGARLWIVSNGDEGLSHGIYYYLQQLGCRWYFPNDRWTIIPPRKEITLKIDQLQEPAFAAREFAGTGGFGPILPVDPSEALSKQWRDWQRRNGFGGEFRLGGHSGEAFNIENKETLLAHPEYLAEVNGKNSPWSEEAKLNAANPEAVQLYCDWTVEQFRKVRKAAPGGPGSVMISVDPADGGGESNSGKSLEIGDGSPSDTTFHIANAAARAVAKEIPGGLVSIYAYHNHSSVPTFPLEPNMFVAIIPYAFNQSGLAPEEFIKAWGKKVSKIGIYDYWSITDWSWCEPSFNYLETPAEKLRFWHKNHVISFSGETTYSAGAMGPGWYVASKLMWNIDTPVAPLLDDFYKTAFGPAREPMKRMMERWAAGFNLNSQELAVSFRDLHEAMKAAAGEPAVLARLDDYGGYLHYLRLKLEFDIASDPGEKEAASLALLGHIWNIYPSAMVHTFRIHQFLVDFGRNAATTAAYNIYDAKAPVWKSVESPSHEEMLSLVAQGSEKYPTLDFRLKRFTGDLVALPSGVLDGVEIPAEEWSNEQFFLREMNCEFEAGKDGISFPLRVSGLEKIQMSVTDSEGKVVQNATIEGSAGWLEAPGEIGVITPKPGRYRLKLRSEKLSSIRVQAPAKVPFVFKAFVSQPYTPRLYVYVPKGLNRIAIAGATEGVPVQFWNADGHEAIPTAYDNGRLITVDVPHGQDGKVWSLRFRSPNYPLKMLNIPDVFAFFPNTLMVPKDALSGKG